MRCSAKCFVLVIIVNVFSSIAAQSYDLEIRVDIPDQGSVRGAYGETAWSQKYFYQFLAIPYAESTAGYNRFRPPIPKRPWDGVMDATLDKSGCPTVAYSQSIDGSDIEDCLHLAVYSKDLYGNYPVMVVLNGEMYFESARSRQPPNYLMEKDIVLVVPQFRTGILGFLSTLTPEIPGNAGAFDAALAMEWVQRNIRYFGGNPDRVTLVGQSGGAIIAHALSISPKVPPTLFHQLILQSGSAISPIAVRTDPLRYARNLAKYIACPGEPDLRAIHRCLIQYPVTNLTHFSSIMTILEDSEIPDNVGVKLTIGDPNGLLPMKPARLIKSSRKYPLLTGVTAHDGMFAFDDEYMVMVYHNGRRNHSYLAYNLLDDLMTRFGIEDTTGALKGLIRQKLISQFYLSEADFFNLIPDFVDLAGIITMKIPILYMAQQNTKEQPNKTFLYSFNYKGTYTRFGYGDNKNNNPYDGGVCHNNENIYLFPYPDYAANLNPADTTMARTMVDLWTSFVENGIPVADGFPRWPPVSTRNGPYVRINRKSWIDPSFTNDFYIASADAHAGQGLLRTQFKSHLFQGPNV